MRAPFTKKLSPPKRPILLSACSIPMCLFLAAITLPILRNSARYSSFDTAVTLFAGGVFVVFALVHAGLIIYHLQQRRGRGATPA